MGIPFEGGLVEQFFDLLGVGGQDRFQVDGDDPEDVDHGGQDFPGCLRLGHCLRIDPGIGRDSSGAPVRLPAASGTQTRVRPDPACAVRFFGRLFHFKELPAGRGTDAVGCGGGSGAFEHRGCRACMRVPLHPGRPAALQERLGQRVNQSTAWISR